MSRVDSCLLLSCAPHILSLMYSFLGRKETCQLASSHTFLYRVANSPLTWALYPCSPILGQLIRTITPKQGLDKRSHIVMSDAGHIYISERFRHRITVFDGNNGKFLRYIGNDKLTRPGGITIDESKHILYVIDRDGVSVGIYYPSRSRCCSSVFYAYDVCACACMCARVCVCVFSLWAHQTFDMLNGTYIETFELPCVASRPNICDVTFYPGTGLLYIAMSDKNKVIVVNPATGAVVHQWGSRGPRLGQFYGAGGIFVGKVREDEEKEVVAVR